MEKQHLPEKIESERLVLKKHDISMAETMFHYVDQDRARLERFMPWVPYTTSVLDEMGYILSTHEKWEAHLLYDFSIFRGADHLFLGNIGVHSISWPNARCEIGYWILGKFEGHGYVSEAVSALCSQLFQHGFNRIEIRCSSSNMRSARVPERLGFRLEGRLEQDVLENGRYRDTLVFAMLKHAWRPLSI